MVRASEEIFVTYSCLEPSNSFSSLQSKAQALTKCNMIFPPPQPLRQNLFGPPLFPSSPSSPGTRQPSPQRFPQPPDMQLPQGWQPSGCNTPMWALSLLPHLRRSSSNVTSTRPSLTTIFKTKHSSIPFPSYFVALFSSIKVTIQCTMFCLIFLLSHSHLESKLHEDRDIFFIDYPHYCVSSAYKNDVTKNKKNPKNSIKYINKLII